MSNCGQRFPPWRNLITKDVSKIISQKMGLVPDPSHTAALSLSGATYMRHAWQWEVWTGTEAICPCHSPAVSCLGCHLQGKGAGPEHLMWTQSWRASGLHPSLQVGKSAADCKQTASGVGFGPSLLTSPPAPDRNRKKVSTYLKAHLLFQPYSSSNRRLHLILGLSQVQEQSFPIQPTFPPHVILAALMLPKFWSERHQELPLQHPGQRASPILLSHAWCCTHYWHWCLQGGAKADKWSGAEKKEKKITCICSSASVCNILVLAWASKMKG